MSRELIDDSILILAAAVKASFDVDLRTTGKQDKANDGSDSEAEAPNALHEPSATDDPYSLDTEVQRLRWEAVARGVQAAVRAREVALSQEAALLRSRGDSVPGKTVATLSSESVSDLTGPMCQQRARYLAWKAAKDRESSKKTRGFNVARGDSVAKRIEAIMSEVVKNLPSTLGPDQDEESDGETEVTVYQPPPSHRLTDEELERHAAIAAAEDDFFQRVQQMQTDFFEKHRKWVDVDAVAMLQNAPTTRAEGTTKSSPSKPEPVPKPSVTADAKATAARAAVEQVFTAVRGTRSVADLAKEAAAAPRGRAVAEQGPLDALKKAAAPSIHRPLRPSQMSNEEYEAASSDSENDTRPKVTAATAASRHVDPAAGATTTAAPSAAAGRANRWSIVEYDDDDEEDDE